MNHHEEQEEFEELEHDEYKQGIFNINGTR